MCAWLLTQPSLNICKLSSAASQKLQLHCCTSYFFSSNTLKLFTFNGFILYNLFHPPSPCICSATVQKSPQSIPMKPNYCLVLLYIFHASFNYYKKTSHWTYCIFLHFLFLGGKPTDKHFLTLSGLQMLLPHPIFRISKICQFHCKYQIQNILRKLHIALSKFCIQKNYTVIDKLTHHKLSAIKCT